MIVPQGLHAHPQLAAAHVAGAPVVTSSMVNAPGMASAVRAAQLSQGVGQLPPGMGQLAQGMGQHLGIPGMPGMPGMPYPHQMSGSIPTAKVIPQVPSSSSPDARKRPFNDQDKGKG